MRGAPLQVYRGHIPGKWMSLSGLTIEVAARTVQLLWRLSLLSE